MLSFFARPLKTDLAPLFKKHVRSSRSREEDGHRCALFLSLFLSCFCNTHVKERELYYFLNRERKRIFSSRPHVTVFSGEDFFFCRVLSKERVFDPASFWRDPRSARSFCVSSEPIARVRSGKEARIEIKLETDWREEERGRKRETNLNLNSRHFFFVFLRTKEREESLRGGAENEKKKCPTNERTVVVVVVVRCVCVRFVRSRC